MPDSEVNEMRVQAPGFLLGFTSGSKHYFLECFPIIYHGGKLGLLELFVLPVIGRMFDLRVVYRWYMKL